MENTLKRLRKEVDQFCSRTTAHGICQISSSPTIIRKYFWASIFLIAFSISVVLIKGLVKLYLSYPVKTDVDVVLEDSLPFPSVTVCNYNQFHRSRLKNDSMMKLFSVSKTNSGRSYVKWITYLFPSSW